MDEPEMKEVAGIMGEVLRKPDDDGVRARASARVAEVVGRFPAYPG
jgi:glycine/serine hydroxymethyltransferase